MDEMLKTLKAQLYDRATSPLFLSFAISWTLWNYRLLIILFESGSAQQKFSQIDTLFPDNQVLVLKGVVFPLCSALAYIVFYPFPARLAFWHIRTQQRKMKELQQKIDDEMPISQIEARELRSSLSKAGRTFDEQIDAYENIITKLKAELANQEAQERPPGTTEKLEDEFVGAISGALSESQVRVLANIARGSGIEDYVLKSRISGNSVVFEYDIDVLTTYRLISVSIKDGERIFSATPAGRAYLVENARNSLEES